MRKSAGEWYWHIHHDRLAERLTLPLSMRLAHIRKWKMGEVRVRLRLLKPVKDVPTFLRNLDAFDLTGLTPLERRKVNTLHRKECPKCPWNGRKQTIFPNRKVRW